MANSLKPQKILLTVQLGSPKSTKRADVKRYLKEFLGDPRVVDLSRFFWWPILHFFILPFRPQKSANAYKRIWTKEGAPLVFLTEKMIAGLSSAAGLKSYRVYSSFLLSTPRTEDVIKKIASDNLGKDYELIILPMFPQYSEATSGSVYDRIAETFKSQTYIPQHKFISHFHLAPSFINGSVRNILHWLTQKKHDLLVLSFHGVPKRRVTDKGDPYERHCRECFDVLVCELRAKGVVIPIVQTFQSRFGTEEWLGPDTDSYVISQVKKGTKKIAIYCPSFLIDCLETLDEIGNELGHQVKNAGGELSLIPCLNDDKQWINELAQDVTQEMKIEMPLAITERPMEKVAVAENKNILRIVFLTLFLDLVGFSIIFPLFPALAKYYLEHDANNFFLTNILGLAHWLVGSSPGDVLNSKVIVLFGGMLGALYSLLQFLAAPLWGTLSDKYGRRPILLWSVFWMAFSYLLWFFSGSFTLLIVSRIIGGLMGGNISTATAVVADVTTDEKRARGMAVVGIAFATGFIIGPAIGGISTMVNLSDYIAWSGIGSFKINPFSGAALVSFILGVVNFIYLWRSFPETLPKEKRGLHTSQRSINILKLFKPLPFPGINLTNIGHFLFLLAFSGMEFTLTFLAVERLQFSPMDNAKMFIFIGFIIVLIQGGVVRRQAHIVGEKNLAMLGIILALPGLILIGLSYSILILYLGLFFLSVGSALVIPCLTGLVSRYIPAEYQGQGIGAFRSLGALARVIGPIAASVIYWQWGPQYPYYLGAAFLIIPLFLIGFLPPVKKVEVKI